MFHLMENMAKSKVLLLVFLCGLALLMGSVQSISGQSSVTIYIRSSGNVEPSAAPIQRTGDTYTLSDDVYGKIVIERDNIVLDCQGHFLTGGSNIYNIDDSSVGMAVEGRNNVTIKNLSVRFYGVGIDFSFNTNCTIANSNIVNSEFGIRLYYCSNCTLQDNTLQGSFQDSVWLYHSSNNSMIQNSFTEPNAGTIGELIGFKLLSSSNFNTIVNNSISGSVGVYLNSSLGNQILQNNVQAGHGIDLYFSPNNTISGNNVFEITVSDASDSNILTQNTISGLGITLNFSSNAVVRENYFLPQTFMYGGPYEGILNIYGSTLEHFLHTIDASNSISGKTIYYLQNKTDLLINPSLYPNSGFIAIVNSKNVTIENLSLSNQNEALLLAFTNNSRIQNNAITQSIHTIRFVGAYNNVVSANAISNNQYGLSLVTSYGNTIQGNSFVNNSWYGIGLDTSSANKILNNIITGSTFDVIFSHV